MNDIKLLYRDNINSYIDDIKKENPKAKFYSYSRLGTFNQCPRSYYYTYIDKKDQKNNVYSVLGEVCHSCLEDLYTQNIPLNKQRFEDEFNKCKFFGINFPESKYDISGNYKKDILNFYKIYNKIKGNKFLSELGFILKIDNEHYIIGYIDLLRLNQDGTADIYDFKTSSDFDKAHTLKAGRQLILYKLAIEQLYGIKVNSVAWQMLKYVNVQIGDNKPKTALKGKEWVSKCSSQIRNLMQKNGYDNVISALYISKCEGENDIESLPENIQKQIKVDVYTREYKVTKELEEEFKVYIRDSIKYIENMEENIGKWSCCSDSFFCKNLCGFYPKHCMGDE